MERVRATWIAGIKQEKARPQTAAMRIMPPLLYGEGHPYAIPFTGSGTEASIASLTRDDLVAFHGNWLQPDKARDRGGRRHHARSRSCRCWKSASATGKRPRTRRPCRPISEVAAPAANHVYLINQPGATQSNVYVGQLVPPTGDAGTIDFDFANGVLGGEFTSRLNMNLREDKHWAYGSYSNASNTLGQRPWFASAAVQTDKTAESIKELRAEITAFASGQKPATAAEIAKIRASNTLSLPGGYETAAAVQGQISSNLRYGRPDDYIVQYKARNDAMTAAEVTGRGQDPRPGFADVRGGRRPVQDRGAGARPQPGRSQRAGRRRQAGRGK